jgi:hypothetical protein
MFPIRTTFKGNVVGTNVATAVGRGAPALTVKVQEVAGFAAQPVGPVVQPLKTCPVPGVAVNVTDASVGNDVVQTLGGPGFAQLISGVTVGFEVLVTDPLPVTATVKGFPCAVNKGVKV